eukprot:CAMPEP_0119012320 /NCGR_PEP_ID=MMETSP1176-20130426/6364_1 /TAXON_ID=265551 /ORGANISM="Synedropsis recta cf, Strain CCMP1620" /LENGTH=481 /DNA_ID=CAMNT_0006965253 /DNA_START=55 /DNA_END=1500 /DNA_ORIENTATION=+
MSNYAMNASVEAFYRSIFADLTVDREEAEDLVEFFTEANPPPDKIVWLRATAFRIGCEFLTDDADNNTALLRAINAIVHAVEKSRMAPREMENTDAFEEDKVSEFLTNIFSDLSVDQEENAELVAFFAEENSPPIDKLIFTRASAFRIGCDFLGDDRDTNVQLLKCINVVVHAFEITCLLPRPYMLQMEVPEEMSIASIGLDSSIEKAVQHLWDLDVNRLEQGTDYVLNVQGGKKPFWKEDEADDPLFTSVDTKQFRSRPTYKAFYALLDNYVAQTGVSEKVTDTERSEIRTFLRAIMETGPMQFCHKYCQANAQNIPSDKDGFMKLLHKIWFALYRRSRGGREDSSGFEHVFIGEIKGGKVSGFHNWVQLYMEEKKGDLDYRGYIRPRSNRDAQTNDDDSILTLQFNWNGIEKAVGTSFIGTSPEFEMALYTICFLVGGEDNYVTLDTGVDIFDLNIRCYRMGSNQIGTSFPEAKSHYEE